MARLDTHEWLMIGIVGLGAYALYRLSQASSSAQPPPPGPAPLPAPPNVPVLLPSRPGTTPTPPAEVLVTRPNELHPQFWYAGRLDVFGAPPGLDVAAMLAASGFGGSNVRPDAPEAARLPRSVQVFSTPSAAAAAGFPAWALSDPGTGTRWFYGRWTGDALTAAVPSYVKLMWRANAPK